MAMKLMFLAFVFVASSKGSSMAKAQVFNDQTQDAQAPIYISDLAPVYNSDSPTLAPFYETERPEYSSDSPIMAPVYFLETPEVPSESPIYFSDYPVMAPIYPSDPPMLIQPITPQPHIPKHCAVGCVEYCRSKPIKTSKRSCQKICSSCCQKCECIPQYEKHMSCGSWDKIMYRGVQVKCP